MTFLELLKEYLPWVYFRLWMLDYLYLIPAATTILSCLISLSIYTITEKKSEADDTDNDELCFGEALSITSLTMTILLSLTKLILAQLVT